MRTRIIAAALAPGLAFTGAPAGQAEEHFDTWGNMGAMSMQSFGQLSALPVLAGREAVNGTFSLVFLDILYGALVAFDATVHGSSAENMSSIGGGSSK